MDSAITPEDKCQAYPRPDLKKFEEDPIPEEVIDAFNNEYRVIPLTGQKIYDYVHKQMYRFSNNKRLECKWEEFLSSLGDKKRIRSPFMFPRIKDNHFYNCKFQYEPSLSIDNFPHYRRTMRDGPGVDSRGQLPIPNDMQLSRGFPFKPNATKQK